MTSNVQYLQAHPFILTSLEIHLTLPDWLYLLSSQSEAARSLEMNDELDL